jgi:hypothetical protein
MSMDAHVQHRLGRRPKNCGGEAAEPADDGGCGVVPCDGALHVAARFSPST